MHDLYRHGDVNLVRVSLPEGVEKEFEGKEFTVALGEATGHHHVLVSDKPFTVFKQGNVRYIKLEFPTKIKHEEHKELIIEPGIYRQDQEQEYDWFQMAPRKVID